MTSSRERAAAVWAPVANEGIRRRRFRSPQVLDAPGGRPAAVWPVSQVVAAALDLHLLDPGIVDAQQVGELLGVLETYRTGPSYGPYPGDAARFVDDNAWVGLDLVQAHLLLRDRALLAAAERVFAWIRSHEHAEGGLPWTSAPGSPRNTCATAPGAQLALWLHLAGIDDEGRETGMRLLAWLDAVLRTDDGVFADHVDQDGTVDGTIWSYNQGTPAGAWLVLGRIERSRAPVERAVAIAHAALDHFDLDALWAQPPVFNAIMFRNLLGVDAAIGVPRVRAVFDALLTRGWQEARDARTGWFVGGGVGRYDAGGTIDQAGWAQMYALAALPPDRLAQVC